MNYLSGRTHLLMCSIALTLAMMWLVRFGWRQLGWIKGPKEVIIHRPDGTDVPCDLVLDNVDAKGVKTWIVANRVLRPGDEIRVKKMPRKTKLVGDWDDE